MKTQGEHGHLWAKEGSLKPTLETPSSQNFSLTEPWENKFLLFQSLNLETLENE